MCGMGAWGVQSQQFSIYFIEHSFFYCFLSNVRRSNNSNMRGMQCDPVLILIFFRYHFLCFDRLEWKTLQNFCVRSAVSKGEWVERGGQWRGQTFSTLSTHMTWSNLSLRCHRASDKLQDTSTDTYIHTSVYLWDTRPAIFGHCECIASSLFHPPSPLSLG